MTWTPDDAEIRRNALRLFKEAEAAQSAASAVTVGTLPEDAQAKINELEDKYALDAHKLRDDLRTAIDAIRRQYEPADMAELKAKADAAAQAYEEAPGPAILTTWDDEPVICGKTGLPIWEDEETVRDDETDETFIRAALGLAPRPVVDDELEEAA